MKVKQIMYAPSATKQFIYKFNNENNTNISSSSEILDGIPFVTVDLKETPPDLIFKFAYTLGSWQKALAQKGEFFLPLEDFPFPPEEV
ncbi:hypothetical protein [Dysgonomonas sp. 25]|uniref:hypothetical protein n=1 Tax=Dysgonomonas sp. 25 TaxID=2302933 RepID=UPI0013CF6166|nr:hypothetical protein [Dysgonomonas sp. 25]NDV70039.1 hypothetical protein [Dysgonomonas sp. 25]